MTEALYQTDEECLESEHLVHEAMMYDYVWTHFGIEKEDFQVAFADHQLEFDEEVAQRHA